MPRPGNEGRGLGRRRQIAHRQARASWSAPKPFPSMPVYFWNDPDGREVPPRLFRRLRKRLAPRRLGRDHRKGRPRSSTAAPTPPSNPGGVRIGTAEIYRQVEQVEEVLESLVIGQDWHGDVRIVLFVRLRPGAQLDAALEARIRKIVRDNASPHHVPKKILEVPDIPRTLSGKLTELAVREVVHGRPVKNQDAMANPQALEHFRDRPELATD